MKLFHFHRFKPTAANPMIETIVARIVYGVRFPIENPSKREVTDILYSCDCGKVKTTTIRGHWTLEQITGKKL